MTTRTRTRMRARLRMRACCEEGCKGHSVTQSYTHSVSQSVSQSVRQWEAKVLAKHPTLELGNCQTLAQSLDSSAAPTSARLLWSLLLLLLMLVVGDNACYLHVSCGQVLSHLCLPAPSFILSPSLLSHLGLNCVA